MCLSVCEQHNKVHTSNVIPVLLRELFGRLRISECALPRDSPGVPGVLASIKYQNLTQLTYACVCMWISVCVDAGLLLTVSARHIIIIPVCKITLGFSADRLPYSGLFSRGNICGLALFWNLRIKFSLIFPQVLKLEILSHVALTSIILKVESYSIDSVIRGYHIYKDIWAAPIRAILCCERESFNPCDPYAVPTLNGTAKVSHVPRVISATCSAFIRRDVASCEVTGDFCKSNNAQINY